MKLKPTHLLIILALTFNLVNLRYVIADDAFSVQPESSKLDLNFEDELAWLREENYVNISTKSKKRISEAPSIITVITAKEIKNLGFRTLSELLRIVPGFEILKSAAFGDSYPAVRGIEDGNQVRVMLDGHLINNPLDGNPFINFDEYPVKNIKKLEIIRGPGSAVYGEYAFMAAINIITMDADDIDGVKFSAGYGSFDSKEGNVLFGKEYNDIEITGMFHFSESDGYDGTVESDFQSMTDGFLSSFFPAVSQAPGEVKDWTREFDLNLKITYKDFYFQGWYGNKNSGPFIGTQLALTDRTDLESNYVFGEVGYKKTFNDWLEIKPRIYYDQFDDTFDILGFPPRATLLIDTDGDEVEDSFQTNKDGLQAIAKVSDKVAGLELPIDFKLFDENTFTLGFEYRYIYQDNVQFSANFFPLTFDSLDSVQDFSDDLPFIKETIRRVTSFYAQDVWSITDAIGLTIGTRYDWYDDSKSGEINPRIGLTWEFVENAWLKLLYGEAFRPPTLTEMFSGNQPTVQGNEDLDPEEIKTYEIELGYKFNNLFTANVNYFYDDIKDLIALRKVESSLNISRFDNFGDARIYGIEAEGRIDFDDDNYIFMNYSYQNPEDDKGGDLPFVAKHKGNIGINIEPWKYINANLNAFISGRRTREPDDLLDKMPSYAVINLSVIAKEFFKELEIQGTVYNLLDKDYADPAQDSIPNGSPRPGRHFFVGFEYEF